MKPGTNSESELISLIIANNKVGFDYLYTNFITDDFIAEGMLHDSFFIHYVG